MKQVSAIVAALSLWLSCGGSPSAPSEPGGQGQAAAPNSARPAKAGPIEYSGIHRLAGDLSLFFPDYSCEPTADKPGMVLEVDSAYREQMVPHASEGPVVHIDVRFRGMLSTKGQYGPDGKSPHRIVVIEVLEMQPADICMH